MRTAITYLRSPFFRYVLRHFIPGTSEKTTPTALQGYGIYLDIKNMEYKNIDDSGSGGGKYASSTS